jgi:hypothetical protein
VEVPFIPGVLIVSDTLYDIRQEQYANVIREFIRHEDDVTNHHIMWLLVGENIAVMTVRISNGLGS